MKNTCLLFVLFLSAVICLSPSCKKKANDVNPISQLPAATQIGANTFGCLVNGQAFTPHSSSFLNSSYQCNYIYTNGGYNFFVKGSNDQSSDYLRNISLGTTILPISEGQTLKLQANQNGSAFGRQILIDNGGGQNTYQTNTTANGEIHITKLDQINQIVSGTFFFDAINTSGDIVHITDGRFDMKYTQ